VLTVLNRELDADFDPAAFDHVATWNAEEAWIEMRLRARSPQRVHVRALDLAVEFDGGEDLLTEISAKFTADGLSAELEAADFVLDGVWVRATASSSSRSPPVLLGAAGREALSLRAGGTRCDRATRAQRGEERSHKGRCGQEVRGDAEGVGDRTREPAARRRGRTRDRSVPGRGRCPRPWSC